MSDRVAWVKFLGVGAVEGGFAAAYIYSTRALDLTWVLPSGTNIVVPRLLTVPTLSSSPAQPLEPISSDASVTLSLLWPDDSLDWIARGNPPGAEAAGGIARIVEYAAPTDTTIEVDDADWYTSGEVLIWVGGETMIVTSKIGTTLTVTRGALGSIARAHSISGILDEYFRYYTGLGPAIFTAQPGPVGVFVEVGYSDTATATVGWRGVIDSVKVVDGLRVEVTCHGLLSSLRQRKWTAPAAYEVLSGFGAQFLQYERTGQLVIGGEVRQTLARRRGQFIGILVDADGTDAQNPWYYARAVVPDGNWAIVPVTYYGERDWIGGTYKVYRLPEHIFRTGTVVAYGDADGVFTFDSDTEEYAETIRGVICGQGVRYEYANVTSATTTAALTDLLTATQPIGWGACLPSAWVDLLLVDGAADIGGQNCEPSVDSTQWAWPAPADRPMLDVVSATMLRPLGISLIADRGELRLIDWRRIAPVPSAATITGLQLRERGYSWSRRGSEAVTAVALQGRASTEVVVNESLSGEIAIATVRAFSAKCFRNNIVLSTRWRSIVSDWGVVLPSVTIQVGESSLYVVGANLTLNVSGGWLPDIDGKRSAEIQTVQILSVDHSIGAGVMTLNVVLSSWSRGNAVATWSPVAVIDTVSGSSGTFSIDIYPAALSADDATPWSLVPLPADVVFFDETGAASDSGTLTVRVGVNFKVSGLTGTPVQTDLIALADATVDRVAGIAYLADAAGEVDGGDPDKWLS